MAVINISSDEEIMYNDFKSGNSVQVRVTVPPDEQREFEKGKTVKVLYGNIEASGKIVSEPLVIGSSLEGEDRTISLIVQKVGNGK